MMMAMPPSEEWKKISDLKYEVIELDNNFIATWFVKVDLWLIMAIF